MERSEIMKNGFDGFLSKPIEASRLLSELSRYLKVIQKVKNDTIGTISHLPARAQPNLPELITVLESDFWNQWKLFESKQPMEDVKNFGSKLKDPGLKFDVDPLTNYGNSLILHVDNFDINNMKDY